MQPWLQRLSLPTMLAPSLPSSSRVRTLSSRAPAHASTSSVSSKHKLVLARHRVHHSPTRSYQQGGSSGYIPQNGIDPLSNATHCLRDAALMQQLGINTIRSYNLDPNLNHDECASIFNAAGIYMMFDVNSPLSGESINMKAPASSYTLSYLNRTFAVLDAFRNYPNTIGFFGANELIYDTDTSSYDPPYVRVCCILDRPFVRG